MKEIVFIALVCVTLGLLVWLTLPSGEGKRRARRAPPPLRRPARLNASASRTSSQSGTLSDGTPAVFAAATVSSDSCGSGGGDGGGGGSD